jgi:release factor glutamine methyltransferase
MYGSPLRAFIRRVGRRWLAWRYRRFDPDNQPEREVKVAGLRLRVLPQVFNPSLHFTSDFFAGYIRQAVTQGNTVLDVGTGSGVLALAAAQSGARRVVAVDINPAAVACARANANVYGLSSTVDVRLGDMFQPVAGDLFDIVVCNPPYLRGEARTMAGRAYWGGASLEWLARFGEQLHEVLHPGGFCLLSIGDAADLAAIRDILSRAGWTVETAAQRNIVVEAIYIFRLTEASTGEPHPLP